MLKLHSVLTVPATGIDFVKGIRNSKSMAAKAIISNNTNNQTKRRNFKTLS